MPQRWERELRGLERLRAPESTKTRIAEGPHGEGMPPSAGKGQRIIAGAVALAVFAGALVFAINAFGHKAATSAGAPGIEPVTFTFSVEDSQGGGSYPRGTMTVGGTAVDGNGSTYTWTTGDSSMVADTFGSEFQFDHWYDVPAGAPIVVDGSADQVNGWVDSCCDQSAPPPHLSELLLSQHPEIPADPGRFVLEFSASWPEGGRTFYFPVRVTPPSEPTESPSLAADDFTIVGTLSTAPDGSPPGLTLGYQEIEKGFPGAGRWDGETVAVVSMLFTFDRPLPTGATLAVTGDADRVEAQIAPARADGGWGDPVPFDVSSGQTTLPMDPGDYLLELDGWWPRGHMGYSVGITIGHPSEPSSSPLPSVEQGVVPDVVGLGEGDARKMLSQAGYETSVKYAPVPDVAAGIVASTDPEAGVHLPSGSHVLLQVSGIDVPVDGYLTPLPCGEADMMPFAHEGMVDTPSPPLYITVNVPGLLNSDSAKHVGFVPGGDGDGVWQVSRDGTVIAVIAVPSLDGIACRGSGIGGV